MTRARPPAAATRPRGDGEAVTAEGARTQVDLVPIVSATLAQVAEASPESSGRTVDGRPTLA